MRCRDDIDSIISWSLLTETVRKAYLAHPVNDGLWERVQVVKGLCDIEHPTQRLEVRVGHLIVNEPLQRSMLQSRE